MKTASLSIVAIIFSAFFLQYQFDTDVIITAMSAAAGLFLFGKVAWSYSFLQGYGVGLKKTPSIIIIILLLFIGGIISALVYAGYQMSVTMPSARANTLQLSLSMASAYIITILYWFMYARKAYYYGSEYEARAEFKYQKGYSDNKIEEKILELRKIGIIK